MSENKKLTATTGKISPLTSKILDKEKLSVYLNAIEAGVNDESVLNIGLTGPYGSGKSSIIDTYVDNYKDHEYLKISLASFKEETTSNEQNTKTGSNIDNINHQIELSILQQIFYRVNASQIPNSRFKRIFNHSPVEMYSLLFGFILWGMATAYIFEFQWLMNITGKKAALWFNYFMLIIFWIGLGFLFYKTYPLIRNLRIKKFTVKGEMEIDKEIDQSILNQYIDEIIYFFERTKYDIVIIEDLDRFENTEIFTKLREINRIVNNPQIGRKIRFIYALRDEMFQGSERTKFFDLIIPVIPFVNPSNSQEQLQAILDVSNIPQDEFSDDFIEDVVTFIDEIDMRLLINIVNEYILYRDNIKILQRKSHDKLFSLIIYKNLYPQDFVQLHTRKGKLFRFIENKEKYVLELVGDINLEINQLKEEKKAIENERQTNINELRAIYINAIRNFIPTICEVQVNDIFIPIEQLNESENFDFIKDSSRFSYKYFAENYHNHTFRKAEDSGNFKEIEKTLDTESYAQRETRITQYTIGHTDEILEHIQSLEQKKRTVKSLDFEQIFKLVEIDPFLIDFQEDNLIRMLLLNGYIDETYYDYISYFHEVYFNRKEYEFIQNVKVGIENNFDYHLASCNHIVKKINKKYFARPTIFNFCLIEHIISEKEKYPEQIKHIFDQFSQKNNRSNSFIDYYLLQETKTKQEFLILLVDHWPKFWEFVVKESNYPKSHQNTYLSQLLMYCSIEQLLDLDLNRVLSESCQKQEDLNLFENIDAKKLEMIFSRLNLKFSKLSKNNLKDNYLVFEIIEKGGHYKINTQMIELLLNFKTVGDLIPVSYTNVLGSGNKKLIEIVNEEIKQFTDEILLKNSNGVEEDEESMAILLNSTILDTKRLIKQLKFRISDIGILNGQLERQLVLKENKIEPSWSNVLFYFEEMEDKKIDSYLVDFLNSKDNYSKIINSSDDQLWDDTADHDLIKNFIANLIRCNELSMEAYSSLVSKTKSSWNRIDLQGISSEKIDFLVSSGRLNMTVENFKNLKELTVNSHVYLIIKHKKRFMELIQELDFDQKDVKNILANKELGNEFKKDCIEQLVHKDEELFIRNAELAGLVVPILLAANPIELSTSSISFLFDQISRTYDQINLLLKYKEWIDDSLIVVFVKKLKGDYYKMLEPKKRPSFVLNELNLNLINELKKRKLIGRFIIDEKKKKSELSRYIKLCENLLNKLFLVNGYFYSSFRTF